jgi:hypothetical protein
MQANNFEHWLTISAAEVDEWPVLDLLNVVPALNIFFIIHAYIYNLVKFEKKTKTFCASNLRELTVTKRQNLQNLDAIFQDFLNLLLFNLLTGAIRAQGFYACVCVGVRG